MAEGRRKQTESGVSVGYGYVVIPEKVSAPDYIQTCYNTETVCIVLKDNTSMIKNCPVSVSAMRDVECPSDSGNLGSLVVFVSEMFHNKPTIIGVLTKGAESNLLAQTKFLLQKVFGNSTVSVVGDAEAGTVIVSSQVIGRDALVKISSNSIDGKGNVEVEAQDDIDFIAGEGIRFVSNGTYSVSVRDVDSGKESAVSITPEEVNIHPSTIFSLFDGSQPMVLGETLKDQLNRLQQKVDLIYSAIENGLTSAGDGGAAYKASMVGILSAKQDADFSSINSEKCLLD